MYLAHFIVLFFSIVLSIPSEAIPQSGSISNPNCINEICQESANCPDGFTSIMNKCFKIVNKELNWEDSKNECVSLGGSLAIVNDCNLMHPLSLFLKSSAPNSEGIWIGASDIKEEGKWIWVDCTNVPMGISFWSSTLLAAQPSGGVEENCAQIDPFLLYYFNDKDCTSLGTPLCEVKPSSVEKTENCVCNDAAGECPDGFDAVGRFCYYLPHDPKYPTRKTTFDNGRYICSSFYLGADLPIFESCDDLRDLVDFINKNEKHEAFGSFWINAKRGNDEDISLFYWGNNETLEQGVPFWGGDAEVPQPYEDLRNNCTISYFQTNYYFDVFECNDDTFANPLCQVNPLLQN